MLSACLAVSGGNTGVALALLSSSVATVTVFVCFNAYVLDYISRVELGRCETLRLFYSAAGWTAGPITGILTPGAAWVVLPFLPLSAVFALVGSGAWGIAGHLHPRLGSAKPFQPSMKRP